MPVTIREATAADAGLIAWVQVEASRSGRDVGLWDLMLPGPDAPRFHLMEQLVRSPRESFVHFGGFLVAEIDGVPVGALSGYAPAQKKLGHFVGVLYDVLAANEWSEPHRKLVGVRATPFSVCMPDTPEDRWVVEWVALKPEARGRGVAAALLDAILARGRSAGFSKAQIAVLIGNTPAERCYVRAGFRVVDDKRDATFESLIGSPGVARMWRDLAR